MRRSPLVVIAAVAAMVGAAWRPAMAQSPAMLPLPASAQTPGGAISPSPSAIAPPLHNPQPLRLMDGPELWTIPDAALQQFAQTGTVSDQRLQRLVNRSGWPEDALRAALLKPYAVDLVAVARFLDSAAGQAFLQQQTRAFQPFSPARGARDLRVAALRAAILAEARGGSLTALGILRRLPAPLVIDLAGPSPLRCSSLPCENPQQCTAVLSWMVFLPACLQAAAGA